MIRTLSARAPVLEYVKVKAPVLMGGETVFRWAPSAFHGFVLLVPSPQGHQAFTLEIGWSARSRFPEVNARPSIVIGPEDPEPLDVPEGIVRLGGLMRRGDYWWELPNPPLEDPGSVEALRWSVERLSAEEANREVLPRIESAVGALLQHGMPFLEAAAGRLGGPTRR